MHRRGAGAARRALLSTGPSALALALLCSFMLAAPALAAEPGDHTDAAGEGEGAFSFTESSGCGAPATLKPFASKKGTLGGSEDIRGPAGDFLGRDIGDIWDATVLWEVPLSGGKTVRVHERALPAFDQVTVNLAAAVEAGLSYRVRSAATYNPRTIGGSYRFSFHAFATSIDMNASQNPFRGDNVLITDMPDAFVQAWKDAGFCWGGDWNDVKDPMHFAWMGPEATPGYGPLPPLYPVETAPAPFDVEVFDGATPLGSPVAGEVMALADGDGDAAADVFRISDHPLGLLIEYARSSAAYSWCSVTRRLAGDVQLRGREVLFGDYDANGRMDLWLVGPTAGTLSVEIISRASEFAVPTEVPTGRDLVGTEKFVAGDFDGDARADLYVLSSDADTTTVDVYGAPSFETLLHTAVLPIGGTSAGDWSFTLGDHDLDGGLDLIALDLGGAASARVMTHSSGYGAVSVVAGIGAPATVTDAIARDFDGDGRVDLQYLDGAGRHSAFLGNEVEYASAVGWFTPPDFECEGTPHTGLFTDDDDNDHEPDIDTIALAGVTYGCNPPENTLYCPEGLVTRGQMAAFFNRMLGLDDPKQDWFTDDDASEFESDIDRIAEAGITYGCNPPENTWFCPENKVTRGQMAAFLARALGLGGDPGEDFFADDADSIFENDINNLTKAGIAFGCTLGDTVNYCPDQVMPRDHMATFLARSLGYLYGDGA